MSLTTQVDQLTITRLTRSVPKSFDEVMTRLRSSIKTFDGLGTDILQHTSSREAFTEATKSRLGPHDFMEFATLDHGAWTGLFGTRPGLKCQRIVFGNPMIAITMMKHDVRAGLFAPVEALVVEREDRGGTDVIMIQPSTIVAGGIDGEGESGKALREAAEALDKKLEKLWEFVAE